MAVVVILVILSMTLILPLVLGESINYWAATNVYPKYPADHSCVADFDMIYCVGGSFKDTYFGPLTPTGVASWSPTTLYPISTIGLKCVVDPQSNYVYCVGGSGSGGAVYFAQLSVGGIGPWQLAANAYPLAIREAGCVIDTFAGTSYIYCVAGAIVNLTHVTSAAYFAPLSPTGGVGAWTLTTPYPIGAGVDTENCFADSAWVYCVGGFLGPVGIPDVTDAVFYAQLSSGGIGSWQQSPNSYPVPSEIESCVDLNVATVGSDFVYCIGGEAYTGGTEVYTSAVYYAPVTSPGIGPWVQTASYPTQIYDQTCVQDSLWQTLYCVGGVTPSGWTNAVYYTGFNGPVSGGPPTWPNGFRPFTVYPVKFLCNNPPSQPDVARSIGLESGFYQTDINIHNPSYARSNALLAIKFVLSMPEDTQLATPPNIQFVAATPSPYVFNWVRLAPDAALQLSCAQILSVLSTATGTSLVTAQGFVIVYSNVATRNVPAGVGPLDVRAEYSTGLNSSVSLQLLKVNPEPFLS